MSETVDNTQPRLIQYDQWLWWCRDNKAVQDRGLGLANCLVCASEPPEVIAWDCGPENCPTSHNKQDIAHHVRFKGCEHQVDIAFSWAALDRAYG